MEIKEYFKGKNVLITGATGFLGKVVLEKLLWEAPDIQKIILLVRPSGKDALTRENARKRFRNDILPSRIFERLRNREKNFTIFMENKIDATPCDFMDPDIGISEKERKRLFNGLDAIIHVAAQVSWDERIDYAIQVNTLATKRLLDYAQAVESTPRFIYISSAYVNGKRTGTIHERPFDPEKSIANELGDTVSFSIDNEIEQAFSYAQKVEAESNIPHLMQQFSKEAKQKLAVTDTPDISLDDLIERERKSHVKSMLSEYGMKQANLHGWTDVYTFSKAMAEMLLVKHQKSTPIAIVRPPGITGALKEPSSGWLEGFHLVDPLIVGMGKGQIKAFPGAEQSLIDTVPVDQVVNLILSSLALLEDSQKPYVYQIGNSQTNPITLSAVSEIWRSYFEKNPMKDTRGKDIKVHSVKFYDTVEEFNNKIKRQYLYPLSMAKSMLEKLQIAQGFKSYRKAVNWVSKGKRQAERVCRFSDLYAAYTMNSWVFSSEETMALFNELSEEEKSHFDFDTSKIDWQSYWHETHIPGMKKYVLKN